MLVTNLVVGLLIHFLSPRIDLVTALCSAIPGGISDIPIIASDMGADAAQVAVMQFVRLVIGIGVFQSLIQWVTRDEKVGLDASKGEDAFASSSAREQKPPRSVPITLAVALLTGLFGKWIGVPAGTLVFSMLGVVGLKLSRVSTYFPLPFKQVAQLLSGAYIGSGMGLADLIKLQYLVLPMALLVAGYAINCFETGFLLRRFCAMSRREGMLAATPAGASDMALISADLGVNSPDLVVLQVIRLVVVVSIFPTVIHLLLLIGLF